MRLHWGLPQPSARRAGGTIHRVQAVQDHTGQPNAASSSTTPLIAPTRTTALLWRGHEKPAVWQGQQTTAALIPLQGGRSGRHASLALLEVGG